MGWWQKGTLGHCADRVGVVLAFIPITSLALFFFDGVSKNAMSYFGTVWEKCVPLNIRLFVSPSCYSSHASSAGLGISKDFL